MLGIMLQKMWHKKWMVLCLLIGNVLLIATVVSFPLYRTAAFDRMLRDEFEQELTENGKWPAMLEMAITAQKDGTGQTITGMENFVGQLCDTLGVTKRNMIMNAGTLRLKVNSLMKREDLENAFLRLLMMTDFQAHSTILAGEMYSDDGRTEDGAIEVVISQECMIASKLLVGETLEFEKLKDVDGEPLRIKIMGVYGSDTSDSFYWQITPKEMSNGCVMNEQLFREIFLGESEQKYTLLGNYYLLFEYEDLRELNAKKLYQESVRLTEDNEYKKIVREPSYLRLLEEYEKKKTRIEATLFILQVPVLILLGAFLFMISGQMYDMERNEISVLKSRGSSGGQIFRLYFYQSIFLALLGTLLGIPLGTLFCRILGSAQNFLEFDIRRELDITYGSEMAIYTGGAILCCILIMTIPAIKHSKVSIVHLKQQKAVRKKSLWQKVFLDVICLGVGIYGYYSFSVNESILIQNVMAGKPLDPLLYLSSSVFIVGAGLLFLRLHPLLIKLIYMVGKRFWGPASYASFQENIKNGRKQQFIMLFLILTISLGMYHATVARTILQNALNNEAYLDGADVVIEEIWEENTLYLEEDDPLAVQYYEPDYFKYGLLKGVESYTKVLYDDAGYVTQSKKGRIATTVMGIHTKEFGETTEMPRELLEKHYYEYLNELAVEPEGVLVSRNFQTVQDYKVGDKLTFYDSLGKSYVVKIVDFVDYWPGYAPETLKLNSDGTVETRAGYLVVANYAFMKEKWGSLPYEVWIAMDETYHEEIYQWVQDNDVHLRKYVNRLDNMEKVMEDPLLQGTNGVLTMGFIVTMILCAVGYMIYWIMSIRSREMLFGVLRACGMHKGELFHMLMNEQIFSGVFSVLAGIGIGKIASRMYVPMLQTAYAASNQVLPMQLITNQTDMLRLYSVIIVTMAICLLVLIGLVFKLNVAKALKLGEE